MRHDLERVSKRTIAKSHELRETKALLRIGLREAGDARPFTDDELKLVEALRKMTGLELRLLRQAIEQLQMP